MSLATYINGLIDEGKIVKFYQSSAWRRLREDVLYEHAYECQECLKSGKVTPAVMVHHVQEVRKRPDLALSRFYTDEHGERQKQLVPLCMACHERIHDKLQDYVREKKDTFTNEERWE